MTKSKSTALFCVARSRIRASPPHFDQNEVVTESPPQGIRARARAELLVEVGRVARAQLAESGAAALSVRAIARELGLASSALYRYYPSRDALLTRLIIESYDALGEAVEQAEAAIERADLRGRYTAIATGVRSWALANPHEFALLYGSPVPGYAAPDDTISPALRPARLLIALAAEIPASNTLLRSSTPLDPTLLSQLTASNEIMGVEADLDVLALGVTIWAQMFGMISFELFGTFHNSFEPADALFQHHIELALQAFGL